MALKSIDCLKLINFIERSAEFKSYILPCKKILIAYSGGQDSSSLLTIFYMLSQKWKFELGVVYCDHGWTNEDLVNEKIFENILQYQLPFYFVQTNPRISQKPENQARHWRYSIFQSILQWGKYDLVLTGHTLSDKAETIVFNLCRGTGLKGVSSLKSFQIFSLIKNQSELMIEHETFSISDLTCFSQSYFRPNFVIYFNACKQIKIHLQKKHCFFSSSLSILGLKNCLLVIFFEKSKARKLTFSMNDLSKKNKNKQQFNDLIYKIFVPIFPKPQKWLNEKKEITLSGSLDLIRFKEFKPNGRFGTYIFKQYKKKRQIKNCLALLKPHHVFFDRTQKQKTIITFFNPSLLLLAYKKFCIQLGKKTDNHSQTQFQKLLSKKQNEKISTHDLDGLMQFLNSKSGETPNRFSFLGSVDDINFLKKNNDLINKDLINKDFLLTYKQSFSSQLKPKTVSSLMVCRPLLKINRTILFQFTKKLKLPIVFDKSNNEISLTRNFIRKKILPLLKQVNPRVEENLYKFSQIVTIYIEQTEEVQCSHEELEVFKP